MDRSLHSKFSTLGSKPLLNPKTCDHRFSVSMITARAAVVLTFWDKGVETLAVKLSTKTYPRFFIKYMAKDNEKVQRIYNFNNTVGQFIEHVDTVNFTMDGNGEFHFNNVGEVKRKLPTPQQMVAAVEQASAAGLWYANTAWAVVFRVYETAGYKGSYSNFVREAKGWPWSKPLKEEPTDDAVSKPLRDGKMLANISEWEAEGISSRNRLLAEALLNHLGIKL